MGPVRQNRIQRTVSLFICVCIALCTIVAHNIAQNRPDSFPPKKQQGKNIMSASAMQGRHNDVIKTANTSQVTCAVFSDFNGYLQWTKSD